MTEFTFQTVPHRGLTKETLEFYRVVTKVAADGTPIEIGFPYDGGKAVKVRKWDKKEFYSQGEMANAGLFGQDRFAAGSAKAITVTEGELDALSIYQMLGSKYPAVSIRGAGSAATDCKRAFKYLDSFEQIYLCFDADDPGQRAVAEVASLFNPNKVRVVSLDKDLKDANGYLGLGRVEEFRKAWWAAKPYLPKGIKGDLASAREALDEANQAVIASFPFPTLNGMTYDIRAGEMVLITAPEKIGKTEFIRAIEHHILKTTDLCIATIHMEESEKRLIQGLAGYELSVPAHLPDAGVSNDDVFKAYESLVKKDGRHLRYDHFGSNDPQTILDSIRYMVAVAGARVVFLDHLTRLVSTSPDDDIRRTLDWLATTFAVLCRDLNFTLFIISHVNDDGQPRDSRMIAKECNIHIALSRDKEIGDADTRNTVSVVLRDNRFSGQTGPAGQLKFNPKTFTLSEAVVADATGFRE